MLELLVFSMLGKYLVTSQGSLSHTKMSANFGLNKLMVIKTVFAHCFRKEVDSAGKEGSNSIKLAKISETK